MIKIVKSKEIEEQRIIPMNTMEPLQVAVIVDDRRYKGHYVMRTASESKFEVLDLTKPGIDEYWGDGAILNVRLLTSNEKLTIELFNEEGV